MQIDLHIHSKNSDGADLVEELVPLVAKAGLDVFALTDHDRADGWESAAGLANEFGLSFIPGIEITTEGRFGSTPFGIHLLAYLPDSEHPELKRILEENVASRITRIKQYITNLSADFPNLDFELVSSIAKADSTLGRPDIAAALVQLGVAPTISEIFESGILSKFSKHYVPNQAPDVLAVIRAVRAAGGVPVIAHPLARTTKDDQQPENFPREHFVLMAEAGLLGIETNHSQVPEPIRKVLENFAAEFNLLTTGSSDYHGLSVKRDNPLGLRTTEVAQLRRILEIGTGSAPTLNHQF